MQQRPSFSGATSTSYSSRLGLSDHDAHLNLVNIGAHRQVWSHLGDVLCITCVFEVAIHAETDCSRRCTRVDSHLYHIPQTTHRVRKGRIGCGFHCTNTSRQSFCQALSAASDAGDDRTVAQRTAPTCGGRSNHRRLLDNINFMLGFSVTLVGGGGDVRNGQTLAAIIVTRRGGIGVRISTHVCCEKQVGMRWNDLQEVAQIGLPKRRDSNACITIKKSTIVKR